ncbi:pilus assembly protein [Neorhizobium lilium]|uniref:Pilus assembly protein n=2 Tax=Neorhizobium lilium TaxID=2503024 RepID=A0A3S3SD22_9HYPH|nr:TadE/TadG family type IV pilus assembly protein [Neorhizobium lilium]RWX77311.1 pilus assembly protein [Neorhizobium lilium]
MILRRFKALWTDRRGVGGVEFALIAPLLLCLYITAFELTIGLSISKRTTRTASTIADLVTQQSSVTPTVLSTMKDVANSIFAPYSPKNLTLKITGVTIDANGNPTVAWSWDQLNGRPYAVGTAVNVPTDMRTPDTFLVRAEVSVTHQLLMVMPGLMPSQMQTITMSRQYFYRQRVGSSITCNGC